MLCCPAAGAEVVIVVVLCSRNLKDFRSFCPKSHNQNLENMQTLFHGEDMCTSRSTSSGRLNDQVLLAIHSITGKIIWPQWLQKLAKWSSCFGLSMEKDWERKHSNEGVFLPDSKSDSLTGILPVSDILSGIMYSNVFYLTYFLASILYSIWHSSWHCILHFVSNTFWHCLSHSIWHSYLTYFLAFKKI